MMYEYIGIKIKKVLYMKLQKKILWTVILVCIFFLYLKDFNDYINFRRDEFKALDEKIERNDKLIRGIISNPLYNYNQVLIDESIHLFFSDSDVKSILLEGENGEVSIYHNKPEFSKEGIIKQVIDLTYKELYLGKVTVEYTTENIRSRMRSFIIYSLIIITIVVAIISFLLRYIVGVIIKPVRELTEHSIEISNGNLEQDIKISTNDEIGILARSFILMQESIREQMNQKEMEIEQKRKAENNLRELNVNLEEKVIERTRELEEALESIKNAQKKLIESEKMSQLGVLVSGVAHEINTPIGITVTSASHMKEEIKLFRKLYNENKVTKRRFEEFLRVSEEISDIILSNMYRGRDLVKSFKNVAVDQTSEHRRAFNLSEYLEEILLSTYSEFKKTKIGIHVNCPDSIVLDSYPGAMSQIVTNLLMNSLIHGFEDKIDGSIEINVTDENEIITIKYSDTGKGIPEDIIDKVFDPFFTTKRGQGGSGLGLSIVYNLVVGALSGEIECFSEDGKGSTFIIKIPKISKEQ